MQRQMWNGRIEMGDGPNTQEPEVSFTLERPVTSR